MELTAAEKAMLLESLELAQARYARAMKSSASQAVKEAYQKAYEEVTAVHGRVYNAVVREVKK